MPAGPDADRAAGLRTAVARRLGIDVRALAAFRVAVGSIVLLDLLYRTRSLTAFYTDRGVLPRTANEALYPTLSRLSIHGLSGAVWVQWALFGLAAVLACLLIVGYRTRTAAVGTWLLLASLQFRNYIVLNGGDTAVLVALFLALFLPLGERWSLDAVAAAHDSDGASAGGDSAATRPRHLVVGFASAALLSQIVLIYATNAVFKLRSDAWMAGTAIPTIYRVDRFTVRLGDVVAEFGGLLVALNYGWVALLVASPLLLVAAGRGRTGLVGAYAAAHVGMYLTLDLGFFPHAMLACLLLFLPRGAWDRIEPMLAPATQSIRNHVEAQSVLVHSGPVLPGRLRSAVGRALPVVTATILVVGLLWQGVAVGYVQAPDELPVDPADHSWKLFAPNPPSGDGYYIVTGRLASNETVDLYPHADTRTDPPPDSAATYPSARWRKYLGQVRHDGFVRRYFADYLCRWGADRYGEPVDAVTIEYVRESVRPGGPTGVERRDLGTYRCPVVD